MGGLGYLLMENPILHGSDFSVWEVSMYPMILAAIITAGGAWARDLFKKWDREPEEDVN